MHQVHVVLLNVCAVFKRQLIITFHTLIGFLPARYEDPMNDSEAAGQLKTCES